MELIRQPEGTSLCGQCVVAMLSNRSLTEVVAFMGDGRNYPRDIRKAMIHFGLSLSKKSWRPSDGRGPHGVAGAAMLEIEGRQHWVAWDGRCWFDPRFGSAELVSNEYTVNFYQTPE